MNKLNFLGIGPKIAIVLLPWLTVSIFLSVKYKAVFTFCQPSCSSLYYTGVALLVLGIIMYFSTVPLLLKGLKETRLVTTGAYYLCCNPLYAAIILFIIPGVALMINSWLILTTTPAGYIIFKLTIRKEYTEMVSFFGEAYSKYRSETPEFFPFPFRKLFNRLKT